MDLKQGNVVRHYIFSLFVISYLSLATPVQAEKIMRWVDENGVTHFANTPPIGQTNVEEVRVQPTNQADVPTKAIGTSLRKAFAAIEENKGSETRSDFVIQGPPKKILTPMVRPSSKRSNRGYRRSFR